MKAKSLMTYSPYKTLPKIFTVFIMASIIAACASIPSTNYGASVVNRTIPERIVDEGIERVALKNLPNVAGLEDMSQQNLRVVIDSFRREVLLTGEVPSEEIKAGIAEMIASMKDVVKVHNYLTVTPHAKGQSHTIHENFLKSKINTRIVSSRAANPSQYKVVVRSDEVYVLGYLMPAQRNQVIDAVKYTTGVARVVALVHLVGRDGEILTANDIMTDNNLYAEDHGSGAVYGGQAAEPEPIAEVATQKPKNLVEPSIIKMEKPPQTGYVQLYNGTNKP